MPILDLQQRARELGRIRTGQKTAKGAPTKLDRFRITSPSQSLVGQVSALYGGTVAAWDNGGDAQWEVVTDATRLPVLVPPQPVSQFYELWSGGGCQRRCDGQTELLKDTACLCGPDPEQRACKPTTRLNVVLRDVPGIGVWRLESHGYYAAVELPDVARFLAQAGGYVSAWLALEPRTVKRPGQDTRRFIVPVLEVDVTPAQLLAGGAGSDAPALAAPERQALPAAPEGESWPAWHDLIAGATTRDELLAIRAQVAESGMSDGRKVELDGLMLARAAQIATSADADTAERRDRLWSQIMAATTYDTSAELEADFWRVTGTSPDQATALQLGTYLDGQGVDV